MMADKIPRAFAEDEHVRGLDEGFVETALESAGDVFGASDPGDIAFGMNANSADGDLDAARVCKDARPGVADFVPANDEVPARMDALNPIFLKPDGGHLGDVERLEGGVEALIGLDHRGSGADGFGNCSSRHECTTYKFKGQRLGARFAASQSDAAHGRENQNRFQSIARKEGGNSGDERASPAEMHRDGEPGAA